jgi:hypothetical protein
MLDAEIVEMWKRGVEIWLIKIQLDGPDSDDIVYEWLQDAPYPDSIYLRWVIQQWDEIRYWTTYECERRLAALRQNTNSL